MAKKTPVKKTEIAIQPERTHFLSMLAKNPNYFGNIPKSKLKPNFQLINDVTYEELTCVGYNPYTRDMEATFEIKKSIGYGTDLCDKGSIECVRFYLDFHDGAGFIDQGNVAVNVHDIPAAKDCTGQSIFPIIYVATLQKKTSKVSFCNDPLLPTLRAILSWSNCPPPDSPDWKPVWGSVKDCDVQIKPFIKPVFPDYIDLSQYLELANSSPALTVKQVAEISGVDLNQLNPQPQAPHISELAKNYEKLKIPASRFAFKMVNDIISDPTSESALTNKSILEGLKIDVNSIIDQLTVIQLPDPTKANVDYEELECVGLDYNTESLVATICIKKNVGYSGDLCQPGSTEYIAFWIDWGNDCKWEYINTVELNVHDIKLKGDCLCYSVSLPLDTTFHRKLCENPNVIRVRGVLSWNYPPSTTDPIDLEFYGNRVDAHIQIKPGKELDPNHPTGFDIIGGIDVGHIDSNGLTIDPISNPATLAFNTLVHVSAGSAFGGKITIYGPYYVGYRYRIGVKNLITNSFSYLNNTFYVRDSMFNLNPQTPDSSNYYAFLPHSLNITHQLGEFTPGTDDKLEITMEVQFIGIVRTTRLQMDNSPLVPVLDVNDGGNCKHYSVGDSIEVDVYLNDQRTDSWSVGSTWSGTQYDAGNTGAFPGDHFSLNTAGTTNPCGKVWLSVNEKVIQHSYYIRGVYAEKIICLQ